MKKPRFKKGDRVKPKRGAWNGVGTVERLLEKRHAKTGERRYLARFQNPYDPRRVLKFSYSESELVKAKSSAA